MNKQDEEKARELAIQSTKDIDDNGKEVYNTFVEAALQEMAAWKEQQIIEKTESWIKGCFEFLNEVGGHNFKIDKFIENYYKTVKEN